MPPKYVFNHIAIISDDGWRVYPKLDKRIPKTSESYGSGFVGEGFTLDSAINDAIYNGVKGYDIQVIKPDYEVIIKDRLKEICPDVSINDILITDVERDCMIAFKIIGYYPNDFNASFNKAWESSKAGMVWEFIYDVWRIDYSE